MSCAESFSECPTLSGYLGHDDGLHATALEDLYHCQSDWTAPDDQGGFGVVA